MKAILRCVSRLAIIWGTASLASFVQDARASEIAWVGAANFPALSEEPSTATSGVAGIGGGALLGISLVPFLLDLQMGALYMQRRTNTVVGLTTTGITRKALEFPVLVRLTPAPVFSVGVGMYASQALGQLSQSVTVNSGVSQASSLSYESAQRATFDYGLVASADVRFPLARPFFIVADLRYLWGLRNVDVSGASGTTVYNRAIEFLAGVSLAF